VDDEELLGVGFAVHPQGLAELEDAFFDHLDRLDEIASNKVIEGPTVHVAEPDLRNVERAAGDVQEIFDQHEPTVTPAVDPAPALDALTQLEERLDAVKSGGSVPIHLALDPSVVANINTVLAEARANSVTTGEALNEMIETLTPGFAQLGVTVDAARPHIEALFHALLDGRLVVEPTRDEVVSLSDAVKDLAAHPANNVFDPREDLAEIQDLESKLAEFRRHALEFGVGGVRVGVSEQDKTEIERIDQRITLLRERLAQHPAETNLVDPTQDLNDLQSIEDKFNRIRATGITGNALTGEAGLRNPDIVPSDVSGEERNFHILATGIADLSREQENAAASANSLRETMTSSHQTLDRTTRENKDAAKAISELGDRMRENAGDAHANGEGLTFEGLATRKLTSSLAELGKEAFDVHSPIIGVAEAVGEITIGHGPLLGIVAVVAALGLAWKAVHGEAQEAAKAQNDALDAAIKSAEGRRAAEQVNELARLSLERLNEDIRKTREQLSQPIEPEDSQDVFRIADHIRLWLEERRVIQLRNFVHERSIEQINQEAEARRVATINLEAQIVQERRAVELQQVTNDTSRLNFVRQQAQAEVEVRRQSFGNEIEAAQFAATEGRRIDEVYFRGRLELAQRTSDANIRVAESEIRRLRATEPKSGPGIPQERPEARDAREAAVEAQEAQIRLQHVVLDGNKQQIQEEKDLAEAARQRAILLARLAAEARAHQARVESTPGQGNVTAGTVTVPLVPGIHDFERLTNEQVALLGANVKPLEVPLILAGATTRENLNVVQQELSQAQIEAERFARRLEAIGEAGQSLAGVAENLNIISEEMSTVLGQAFQLVSGIGQIRLANLHIQEAGTDQAKLLSAQLEKFGAIVGVVGEAVGVIAGIGHALFGGGESVHDRVVRENTQAIEHETAARRAEEEFRGAAVVDFADKADSALATFFESAQEHQDAVNALVQAGVDRTIANLQVPPAESLTQALSDVGLSMEDLQVIADKFGITVVDNGQIVAEGLKELDAQIRESIRVQFQWQDTFDDQQRRLALESRLSGVEQTPQLHFEQEVNAAIASGSEDIRQAFAHVDFGDPVAVRRALVELEHAFATGTLDFDHIGALTRDEWLRLIEDGADFLDSFNKNVQDASRSLSDLNVPEGFRRAAIAFETGSPGPPGGTPPLTFPGGPVVEPRAPDRGVVISDPATLQAIHEQRDATTQETEATKDQTDVATRQVDATVTLSDAMTRQTLATERLIAALTGQGGTAPPTGNSTPTGLQGPRTSATAGGGVTVHGGLSLHVVLPNNAPPSFAVQTATDAAMREALRKIGLVQSGDTLQIPVR
jgi:hypothetical protein